MLKPRRLRVHVQVDRLPDLADNRVQLAIRLSAAIDPRDGAAIPGDRDAILPWKWQSADQPGRPWTPHAVGSWMIWQSRYAGGSWDVPIVVPPGAISFVDAPSGADPARLLSSIETKIDQLLGDLGPTVLETNEEGDNGGRKVFPLVETLTAIAAPIPAALKVWTCATIDVLQLGGFGPEDIFIAAPQFHAVGTAPAGAQALDVVCRADVASVPAKPGEPGPTAPVPGKWEPTPPPTSQPGPFEPNAWPRDVGLLLQDPANKGTETAWVYVSPSLPMSYLNAVDHPDRLVDPSTLTIRNPPDNPFEFADWVQNLPTGIAEVIDPAARAIAVAHPTIQQALSEADEARRQSLIAAIVADMGPGGPDLLRCTLTALHGPVIWPRRRASQASGAPVMTLLTSIAEREQDLRNGIVGLLLAHADEATGAPFNLEAALDADRQEVAGTQPGADILSIRAISKAAILGVAGVPPSPDTPWTTDASTTALLEDAEGFLRIIAEHWTTQRKPRKGDAERTLGSLMQKWTSKGGVSKLVSEVRPIVDLSRLLPPASGAPVTEFVQIPLKVIWPGPGLQLSVVLAGAARPKGGGATAAEIAFNLNQGRNVSGKITGLGQPVDLAPTDLGDNAIVLELRRVKSGDAQALHLSVNTGSTKMGEALIDWAALTSGLVLTLKPGATVQAGIAQSLNVETINRLVAHTRRDGANAVRGALSLAYAGPAIPWLMLGRIPIEGAGPVMVPPDSTTVSAETLPLRERLPLAIRRYLDPDLRDNWKPAFELAFDAAFRAALRQMSTGRSQDDVAQIEREIKTLAERIEREVEPSPKFALQKQREALQSQSRAWSVPEWNPDLDLQAQVDIFVTRIAATNGDERLKYEAARTAAQNAGLIAEILDEICGAARKDAIARAERLIPASAGTAATTGNPPMRAVAARLAESGRISEGALPLVFTFDQLQAFDEGIDLWQHLAGLGVLIARAKIEQPASAALDPANIDGWWSLNVATLHSPKQSVTNEREDLVESNAVNVQPASVPARWEGSARVDPVPYAVGEISGVRTAAIRYENQSIVAEMDTAERLQRGSVGPAQLRRPEAYLFPTNVRDSAHLDGRRAEFPKLPPLTFGRTMHVLPYLIAHGGALPIPLRERSIDPVTRKPYTSFSSPGFIGKIDPDLTHPHWSETMGAEVRLKVRTLPYLRSRPTGAPRLAQQGPGIPPGVEAPLARELPIRPAPITLRKGVRVRFFLDRGQERGVLSMPQPGPSGPRHSAIRIDIGEIDALAVGNQLSLTVWGEGGASKEKRYAGVTLSGALQKGGLRIEFGGSPIANGSRAVGLVDRTFAEDEPEEKMLTAGVSLDISVAPSEWRSTFIEIVTDADWLDAEPPRISFGFALIEIGKLTGFTADDDRVALPPEVTHQSRSIHILDGMDGRRTWPSDVELKIRRPAVDVATYDRWINGSLGGFGTAATSTIRDRISAAHKRATKLNAREDRSIDDPAVEAIAYEVVQIFPERKSVQSHALIGEKNDLNTILALAEERPALIKIGVNEGVRLAAGGVYELRIYGAMREKRAELAPLPTAARFVSAISSTWRDVQIGGARWHLAEPLILTFEVATSLIFDFFGSKPLRAMLARPPETARDRVFVRLAPRVIAGADSVARKDTDSYPKIRYIDRVALMEQRWSWRGRPQPEIPSRDFSKLGYDLPPAKTHWPIDGGAREYLEAAFVGRLDDDVGEIREARLTRAHIYARRSAIDANTSEIPAADIPILFDKELWWRGGANLWRFAVRGKSRYGAMRLNEGKLVTFSHRDRAGSKSQWFPLIVPDRESRRRPQRPGLALVLPLTEPLMEGGSVPPLLALFNETMFENFNAADGVEAVIEIARHPLPKIEEIVRDGWNDDPAQAPAKLKQCDRSAIWRAWRVENKEPDPGSNPPLDATSFKLRLARGLAWGAVQRNKDSYDDVYKAWDAAPQNSPLKQKLEERRDAWQRLLDDARARAHALHDPQAQPPVPGTGFDDASIIKYWPEIAPDPIRTADASDGKPVALRVDGPVGYTFDLETDAGRFDHSGLLISPVATDVRPWSMIKLRFRRLEAPELLRKVISTSITREEGDEWVTTLKDDGSGVAKLFHDVRLTNLVAAGTAPSIDPYLVDFRTAHEGVVLDVDDLAAASASNRFDATIRFLTQISLDPEKPGDPDLQYVRVTAEITEAKTRFRKLTIAAHTALGPAGEWSIEIDVTATVLLRLVVSQRPKPNASDPYKPSGDLSVRVRIVRGDDTDVLLHATDNAWLSVLCLPLNADGKLSAESEVRVRFEGSIPLSNGRAAGIRPVRLSDFTPGTWCQFAAIMSRFRGSLEADSKPARGVSLRISDLKVVTVSGKLQLEAKALLLSDERHVRGLTLVPDGAPDASSQLEEVLFAVITYFVRDAFDRLRERPHSVFRLSGNMIELTRGERVWPSTEPRAIAGNEGRVRFLRVLRGKSQEIGGFVPLPELTEKERFNRLFRVAETADNQDPVQANPPDAEGMVLGISAPLDWSA